MNEKPDRCIDPVTKYCQACRYGRIVYPDWVETYSDTFGCSFDTVCDLGFDKGRPEDEPTYEEWKEFNDWFESRYGSDDDI